jgi:hypothetical protein
MSHHEMPRTSGSRIASKIESHPQLAAKVTAMLPAGMSMQRAARGFKNQGQFIAALKASQRTGIPFTDLKRAMVVHHESLGQAVHNLRGTTTGGTTTGGTTTGGTTTGGTTTGGTTTGGTTTGGTTTGGTTSGGTTPPTTGTTSAKPHR